MRLVRNFGVFICFNAVPLGAQLSLTVSSSTGAFSLTCADQTIVLTAASGYTGATVSYSWTNPQLNVVAGSSISASVSGIYTLAASSGTISETKTVSVTSNTVYPTISITASNDTISCTTPSVLMNVASNHTNVTYGWTEPGVGMPCATSTCIAYFPGVYGVTVTNNSNGCRSTATISISENRIYPVLATAQLFTVACPNGTVDLEVEVHSPTVGLSYQWVGPPGAIISGANTPVLNTNASGAYTLTVTNKSSGCSTQTEVLVYACVGIGEKSLLRTIRLFPNPFVDELRFESERVLLTREYKLRISNTLGEVVFAEDGFNLTEALDLSFLNAGIYYLTAESDGERNIFKIVKEQN